MCKDFYVGPCSGPLSGSGGVRSMGHYLVHGKDRNKCIYIYMHMVCVSVQIGGP